MNEILAHARMKSAGADEIKSTHPVLTPDFIPTGDFIVEDDLFHPTWWISLKNLQADGLEVFLAGALWAEVTSPYGLRHLPMDFPTG